MVELKLETLGAHLVVCEQSQTPPPPPPLFIATCKHPHVYQLLVVFPRLSVPGLHMIIDSIKRGPSIASRHFDLHSYSHCDGVLLMP